MYLLKAGFLDGAAGFAVAVLGSYYVFFEARQAVGAAGAAARRPARARGPR